MIHSQSCPFHKSRLVSMPRNPEEANAESYGYAFKCPIRFCAFGILSQIDDLLLKDFDAVLAERDFLLTHCVESEDGLFTFPNGDTYRCKAKGTTIDLCTGYLSTVNDDATAR
jgi:hypothetical protein